MDRKLLLIGLSLIIITFLSIFLYRELSPEDNKASQTCSGVIAYDWNKPVQKDVNGFPRFQENEILHNNNWVSPINYAEGTLYYRAEIKRQPEPKDMRLQLCFWQSRPGGSTFDNENCGDLSEVEGVAGNVVTWSTGVQNMWKKDGIIIDWTRPRYWVGVAVKNMDGKPVSDYNGWNWNGENPDDWYPLDMRFTMVVVPKGSSFCGWNHYIDGASPSVPVDTSTPTNSLTPTTSVTPIPTNTGNPVISNTPMPTDIIGNRCGKADTDGDGRFTIEDFVQFALAYGIGKNTCVDKDEDYGPCGGRDVNRDGKLSIQDFGELGIGFAQRYYPKTSCNL